MKTANSPAKKSSKGAAAQKEYRDTRLTSHQADSNNCAFTMIMTLFACFRHGLKNNLMIKSAIPVIAVSNAAKAEDYYCRVLGFQRTFAYRPDPAKSDPCYMGVSRDGIVLHLHSFKPERAGSTDAFLWVENVDALFAEFSSQGATCRLRPTDQTWGNREMGICDPDGNVLVFATTRS